MEEKQQAALPVRMGIDVGSTTVKIAILNNDDKLIYGVYERHRADIRKTIITEVNKALDFLEEKCPNKKNQAISVKVTGSGGLSVSQWLNIPFIQEVIAATTAVKKIIPQTDVVIELGGEDAKITYFKGGVEQRMNGTCAGGTGSFIDQMAALLETDAMGLNELAKKQEQIYPIAARCGVFAKTDIQPLINEGARKEDIAASIFQAVVNQTISGLACGKPIRGNVAFLGGPLHFLDQLRERFIQTLKLKENEIIVPENSQLFVAAGCAYSAERKITLSDGNDFVFPTIDEFRKSLENLVGVELNEVQRLEPLFKGQDELDEFTVRHSEQKAKRGELSKVGRISISLSEIKRPVRLTLTVTLDTCKNSYPVWVYPETKPD
ncbi:MAG: 2-hydroxyglutaryl-CoA dehydratase, partial [Treponema sp.]|nr:2-hydroxyglutaryl-CoA dehydratase [Treponema sp.]